MGKGRAFLEIQGSSGYLETPSELHVKIKPSRLDSTDVEGARRGEIKTSSSSGAPTKNDLVNS